MAEVTDPALNGQFDQIRDETAAGANTKLRVYNAFKNLYDTLKASIGLKANTVDVITALAGKMGKLSVLRESPALWADLKDDGFYSGMLADGAIPDNWMNVVSTVHHGGTIVAMLIGQTHIEGNTKLYKRRISSDPTTLAIISDSGWQEVGGSDASKADKDLSINTQTASYTLALNDRGGMVRMNVASANTLTVPPNSAVAFPVGTQIVLAQAGAGQTTVVAGSGVTINAAGSRMKLTIQYSGATLVKVASDQWLLMGDLST